MRLAASIQRLILSILLACRERFGAFFAFSRRIGETACESAPFRRLSIYPALRIGFDDITVFPARFYFGPFAIGPPTGERRK